MFNVIDPGINEFSFVVVLFIQSNYKLDVLLPEIGYVVLGGQGAVAFSADLTSVVRSSKAKNFVVNVPVKVSVFDLLIVPIKDGG